MTPEQIAAKLLLDINDQYQGGDSPIPNATARALLSAIAAALREARNAALEEMEGFVSGNKWKLAGDIKTLGHNEACGELLTHIEALKHKDGQP